MIKALLISFIIGANGFAGQNTTSSNVLGHMQGTWSCGCEGTYDVCSVSTCYYSDNCGYGQSRKEWPNKANKQASALILAKNVEQNVGTHYCVLLPPPVFMMILTILTIPRVDLAGDCNCDDAYNYCSFTTCYGTCS